MNHCESRTFGRAIVAGLFVGWTMAAVGHGCGSGGGEDSTRSTAVPKSALLIRAENACAAEAREPAVEYVPTVPCVDRRYRCCIAPGDRASEYDWATNTIHLVGEEGFCREWVVRNNLPCEYENAVSYQNAVYVDRCVKPC